MTAHRTQSRHYRAAPARTTTPAHLAHLHPDSLPPSGYDADGRYNDTSDDLGAPDPVTGITTATTGLPVEFNSTAGSPATAYPTRDETPAPPIPFPAGTPSPLIGLPVALNSTAASPATPLPAAPDAPPASGSPPRRGEGRGERSPNPDDEHTDEDAIFRDPYLPGGRETQLVHTALPLRHRIYALHCQGRSISAIARRLRLDRGTVARHLHAVEDLLLVEQTADLARLRLRAVEAQHAILAAAWDALLCEELSESDDENAHPYPARRAQLLATAARAARTAAQLQGLFTPAALAAALRDVLPVDATPAAATPAASVVAHRDAPDDGSFTSPACPAGLPRACNSRAGSPTTPLPTADPSAVDSGSPVPAREGGWGVRSASASPLPRTGEGPGEGSLAPSHPRAAKYQCATATGAQGEQTTRSGGERWRMM